ncbi:MAG: bifunctional phosphoglucose/phosphomannose isomerase [Candidatus Kaiserbacteria bacterium]|nr:bifunctional phosphoglucose/phosphomannose isomerase [Candidatus Kaiserbacteria bacterium]
MHEDLHIQFQSQFTTELKVERSHFLQHKPHTIVCGMGGSHLPAWLVKNFDNQPELSIHRDYGLPVYMYDSGIYDPKDTLVILSSYSGNTEEILDAAAEALVRGCSLAAITTGGELADFARTHNIPLVILPEIGLEPRLAIGFGMRALALILEDDALQQEILLAGVREDLFPHQDTVNTIALFLKNKIPLIWASNVNTPLSYIWKVHFNETTKVPAFIDVCPELCHNDLSGFDVTESTSKITDSMGVVIFADPNDNPRIQKRMQVASQMLIEKGIGVYTVELSDTGFSKAFKTILLGDAVARELATGYGVPFPQTPLIAEFKKRMSE